MKTLKLFIILVISTITLNSYSVNISNHNIEPNTDSIITVNQTGFNKIIDKIQNGVDKIINKIDNKISKEDLIIFSVILLLLSIICPIVIIGFGFMASYALLWLLLLGTSCLFSIIGGIILVGVNNQKAKSLIISLVNGLSIILGVLFSIVWAFLALFALISIGEY
jgi:hypothetical protein